MKLAVLKSEYKCGNLTLSISPDYKRIVAYSYDWCFVHTDAVGNVFVNTERCSNTTSKHQGYARRELADLGIQYTTISGHTRSFGGSGFRWYSEGIGGVKGCVRASIKSLIKEARGLKNETKRKGTHKAKNARRLERAKDLYYRARDLRRILLKYVDKAPIPMPKVSMPDAETVSLWENWYRKGNGKVNTNGLREFFNRYRVWHNPPESIERIKVLLGVKGNESIDFILAYRHVTDTERMIPDQDSAEYKAFQRWVKRIGDHPRNVLLMDKLHTFQINRINSAERSKNYTPREPVKLNVHPNVAALKGIDGLRILDTDTALRGEGRRQSHCIGGETYQRLCREGGYTAVNYKGYTFLIDPHLGIDQTHGRFNSHTPHEVRVELYELINGERKAVPNE